MDNTKKFSGKAEVYQKARPSYAQELLDFFAQSWQIGAGSLVADIGSGTGILTRQLPGLGAKVFAVEPNADMRAKAE
jgi:16S rRNA A1518/A1519 N6-dimethyltransferase RsmA/KsgA/DIM1 with predicted DNA glycosylase/AP lyase activity